MNGSGALWPKVVIAGVLALLLAGLIQLFRDRFATGDVYPEYSSLRGDPLGTRVFHDALADAGIDVSRNFRDPERADPGRGTIVLSGLRWSQITGTDTGDVKALLDSVRSGSRLILAFAPQEAEREIVTSGKGGSEARRDRRRRTEKKELPSLAREFGVDVRWLPAEGNETLVAVRVGDGALPGKLPWHTALSFEPEGDRWTRMYDVGRYGAVLERSYGKGAVVLLGDAYLVSNEAMVRDRQSALLAWLIGPHRRVVFDETHLGVMENTGIAALARRYGLAHTALALVVVACLFFWKNGTSLVPAISRADTGGDELAGRDASSGLVNLLRRTVPPEALVPACIAEYKRAAPWRRLTPETQRSLEAIGLTAGRERRRVAEAMRAAHELLKRKI